ncbi:MAG: protein-L-isoaspartate O-methyltransferase family protein [Burkholderiaceae bacterium]
MSAELGQDATEQARFNMIAQQIRPWDVMEPRVLAALQAVARERFVPPGLRSLAFVDTEIPLPEGQCMFAPKLEARLAQELDLLPTDHVLEIGAGSGHMAALLSRLCDTVISLEIRPRLVQMAKSNLEQSGIQNVTVALGNGLSSQDGWSSRQFDAVLVSGGLSSIPESLLDLLKTEGRLVAIVGEAPIMRAVRVQRRGSSLVEEGLFETLVPPLDHSPRSDPFKF